MANRSYDARYEPRPGDQAREDEFRYQRFIRSLSNAGLGRAERAEACAVAVLCAFERRISGGGARELNEELPWVMRDLLRRCELHPRSRPERLGREDLVARIGEDLGVDADEATRVTRIVLSTVRTLLSEKEASAVMAQLPPDVAPLWAPPA
jgi:uncharacterized protein (DUF2267 family)